MKKHIIKYSIVVLVCLAVIVPPKNAITVPAVALIPFAVVGALILAGASMNPTYESNFYSDFNGFSGVSNDQILLDAYQTNMATSSLGLDFHAGRQATLFQAIDDFMNQADAMQAANNAWLNDALTESIGAGDLSPPVGAVMNNEAGNVICTGITTYFQCLSELSWSQVSNGWGGWNAYYVHTVGLPTDYPTCTSPSIIDRVDRSDFAQTTEPVNWAPTPAGLDPGTFGQLLDGYLTNGHPTETDAVLKEDIENVFKGSPPANVGGSVRGDTSTGLPDITDVEIAELPPEPVPIEEPLPIDPLIDNELLQGIYNNTLATAKNTKIIGDKELPVFDTSPVVNAIGDQTTTLETAINNINIDFDNSIVEANTQAIKETNQEITDRLESWEPDQVAIDGVVNDFDNNLDTAWTGAVSDMNTTITNTIENLEPISEDDKNIVKAFFTNILPAAATCTPLDFSFRDKEIIIGCEISDNIKMFLSFFLYISTVFLIYTMVHRELRPKV